LPAAAVLIIVISVWIGVESRGDRAHSPPSDGLTILQPMNTGSATLAEGAARYLSQQLETFIDVAPLQSIAASDAGTAASLGSLRLTNAGPRSVAALDMRHDEGGYRLTLHLRRGEASLRETFSAPSAVAALERATQWLDDQLRETPSLREQPSTLSSPERYALNSYFEGLAADSSGESCHEALPYYRAALERAPDLHSAHLRLADCERQLGRPHEAAALATALLSDVRFTDPEQRIQAALVGARSQLDLGNRSEAEDLLTKAPLPQRSALTPLARLRALNALALGAQLRGDLAGLESINRERLALTESEYPLPAQLAGIHLELAANYLASGDHDALIDHAGKARGLAEEAGDMEHLMQSYRYLASSYFRNGEIDAGVQLALAAAPVLERSRDVTAKAYFLQFSAMALNLRGLFAQARTYTDALRALDSTSSDPMYGAIADLTVMHRLYVQADYENALALARATRARLDRTHRAHAATPLAMSFEAIAAARGGTIEAAEALTEQIMTRYPGMAAMEAPLYRARGHIAARRGDVETALALLRRAETGYREAGVRSVANYIGYEIAEIRFQAEGTPPWDDIERLSGFTEFDYPLARLRARGHAANGDYIGATAALEEARLRGNELWSEKDQLLLERYRSSLSMAEATITSREQAENAQ
jgi:tetratricopeptide (TPR) repeat protein